MRVLFFSSMTVSPGSGGGNTVFNLLEPAPAGSEVLYATPADYPSHWQPFPELAGRVRPFTVPARPHFPGDSLGVSRLANRWAGQVHAAWSQTSVVRQLLQLITKTDVQVLLLCPQSMLDLSAAVALTRKLCLPAAVWFMDDYYGAGNASRQVAELWARSRPRFVISEAMRERFSWLYGGECEVLNNSVPAPYPEPARPHALPLRIAYAGAAHSYYLETLAIALRELAGLDGQLQLDIYTYDELPPALAGGGCLPYHRRPVLPCRELSARLRDYDVLLLVSSFRPDHRSLAETSLASKTAEYLASGRCILVFGPPYAEDVRYAQRYGFAEVATRSQELRPVLLRLLHDPGRRRTLGERAYEFARAHHDQRQNSARLWRGLFEACGAAIERAIAA